MCDHALIASDESALVPADLPALLKKMTKSAQQTAKTFDTPWTDGAACDFQEWNASASVREAKQLVESTDATIRSLQTARAALRRKIKGKKPPRK